MLRYHNIQEKPARVLDLTSLTPEEFASIVPAFEASFQDHMQQWTMTGRKRTQRSFSQYTNCPLPTAEDRLLFVLTYLRHAPRQVYHGQMFGLIQSSVSTWLNILIPILQTALQTAQFAPSRTLDELRQRLDQPTQEGDDTLFFTTAPNDPSRAPKTRVNRKTTGAARRTTTP